MLPLGGKHILLSYPGKKAPRAQCRLLLPQRDQAVIERQDRSQVLRQHRDVARGVVRDQRQPGHACGETGIQ
jgi:hypothetical protein